MPAHHYDENDDDDDDDDDDIVWISDHLCVKRVKRSKGCRRHQAQIGWKPEKTQFWKPGKLRLAQNLESKMNDDGTKGRQWMETTKVVWNAKFH